MLYLQGQCVSWARLANGDMLLVFLPDINMLYYLKKCLFLVSLFDNDRYLHVVKILSLWGKGFIKDNDKGNWFNKN